MDKVIANRIKTIISEKGLKGRFVEEKLGKPKNWLSRVTNGRQIVTAADIVDLSNLLQTPIDCFFMPGGSQKMNKSRRDDE